MSLKHRRLNSIPGENAYSQSEELRGGHNGSSRTSRDSNSLTSSNTSKPGTTESSTTPSSPPSKRYDFSKPRTKMRLSSSSQTHSSMIGLGRGALKKELTSKAGSATANPIGIALVDPASPRLDLLEKQRLLRRWEDWRPLACLKGKEVELKRIHGVRLLHLLRAGVDWDWIKKKGLDSPMLDDLLWRDWVEGTIAHARARRQKRTVNAKRKTRIAKTERGG